MSNIYRIFCCFDEGSLVVLFHGFQKKTQKTPRSAGWRESAVPEPRGRPALCAEPA
ncbi:MAG: type II toxin-antitoxin system RelE/ParE family toxin, partial [Prevotella sp.]|nr:type II toxin-antitoxin system RelE/ParE family toxin [Prevotella sp.]